MATRQHLKIGILVPSSNTALEPLTTAILSCYAPPEYTTPTTTRPAFSPSSRLTNDATSTPNDKVNVNVNDNDTKPTITVHFARFPVTDITLSPDAINQFSTASNTPSPILQAAHLLATAHVSVIGWSGTSAGWLGFESDEALCRLIEADTGIPATTSTLGLNRALREFGLDRDGAGCFGMVTPYRDDVQAQIGEVYARQARWAVVERHLGIARNADIADVAEEELTTLLAEVLAELKTKTKRNKGPSEVMPVSTFCTNLKAAHMAERWEREFAAEGLVLLDSVATVVWDCLRILGRPKGEVRGWGRLFEL